MTAALCCGRPCPACFTHTCQLPPAGFLFNEAALALEEKGPKVLQQTVLKAWAAYMGVRAWLLWC